MHIQTQRSQLFWGSVPCSRTLTCSLGSRIWWPPSHWSTSFITSATATYSWCCDDATKYTITSESADAKKIRYIRLKRHRKCEQQNVQQTTNLDQSAFSKWKAVSAPAGSENIHFVSSAESFTKTEAEKKHIWAQSLGLLRNASSQSVRTTGCIRGSRENKHWRMSFLNTWCFSQPQIPKFARDTAKPIHSRATCHFTL